jgi:integrase
VSDRNLIAHRKEKMAYIRKLRDKWQVVIRRKNYPNISKVFIQKSLANKWAKETELAMEKEQFEDLSTASSTLLKSLLQRYRDEITSKKKSARSETYRLNWLIRHKISDVSLTRLKSKDLYDLRSELTELDKAPATIKHYLTLLANVWNVAQRQWGINLPVNSPFKFFKFGKINNQRERILTHREYQDLLAACSGSRLNALSDVVKFAYQTGARFNEIKSLKRLDVNFIKKICTFRDTKNGEDRTIALSDESLSILKIYPFGDIFFNFDYDFFYEEFVKARKKADLNDFRFHDLRACAITNMFLSGMNISQVAHQSGHKTWSQLKRYTRIKATDLVDQINNIVVIK